MFNLTVNASSGRSEIYIGSSISNLADLTEGKKIIYLADKTAFESVKDLLPAGKVVFIPNGENNKCLATVEKAYQELFNLNVDKSWFAVGVGGGLLSDIAGFIASTYLRGIPFGFIPTTLLAMVDASVGGKNGVNFSNVKNLIGTTTQPKFCLCDPVSLKSLPQKEYLAGFSEAIKHGFIKDPSIIDDCNKYKEKLIDKDPETLSNFLYKAIAVKKEIVEIDEFEKHERKSLNLGHTVGHAIEVNSNLKHGEAVSIGIVIEAKFAVNKGLLSKNDLAKVINSLEIFNLPVKTNIKPEIYWEALLHDKKILGESVSIPLLTKIGGFVIEKISLDELKKFLFTCS